MKKALSYFVVLSMLIMMLVVPTEQFSAYEANLSVGVDSSTVKIGDTVTVTVKVPDVAISGPVSLYFSTDVLEYVSTSTEANVVGGTVTFSIGKGGMAQSDTVTVKLKAKTSGSATIKVEATGDIFDYNSFDEVVLKSASTSVTVENKATEPTPGPSETQKSDDNSLSSLKLSSGTLSPSFQYSVTSYTATVGYDVTKVVVSAKASNEKATIESVTGDGNVNLSVGENTIQVVVRAENGVKATYTIIVTRKAQEKPDDPEPSESESQTNTETETTTPEVNEILKWNGEQLYVVDSIPTDKIPSDFESKLLVVNGEQMQGLSFKKGSLLLLYLNNTNGAGAFYVYNEAKQSIYPFVKVASEQSYVLVLVPDDEAMKTVPEGYEMCTLSIEGKGSVTAFQKKEEVETTSSKLNLFGADTYYAASANEKEFYLLYCMNHAGEMGWYVYDSVEKTFMRYLASNPSVTVDGNLIGNLEWQNKYAELEKTLNKEKTTQYIIIAIASAVVLILLIIILVLAAKKRGQGEDVFEEDDTYDEEVDETELSEVEVDKAQVFEVENNQEEITVEEEIAVDVGVVEEVLEEKNKTKETEEEFIVDTMTEEEEVPEEDDDEIEIEFYHMSKEKTKEKEDEEDDLVFIDFE